MLGDPCRPQAQGDRCDRRSVRPLHPAGHSRLYPVRQRTGVPRQGSTGMDRGCRCHDSPHRTRQPLGEREHRVLQRPPARRAARRRNLLHSPRGPNRHRELAAALQHDQAARIARIQAASTGGICPCLRRVAGCATPTGSAGHASATASLKLTFHLDHSVGANQQHPPMTPEQARQAAYGPWEFQSEKWEGAYIKLIDATIAALKSAGVLVIWVGLPSQRDTDASADSSYLNELYRSQAEKAGIVYVDIWDGFVDEDGQFSTQGPDHLGQTRRLRTSDGVYFTKFGARKLALYVEREIERSLSSQRVPVALPVLPEPEHPGRKGKAGGSVRPMAGPVVPLTGTNVGSEQVLLGGPDEGPGATVELSGGEAVAAPSGRADDFSWPRGVVNVEPVAVEPIPPDDAKSAMAAERKSAMDAYAAQTGREQKPRGRKSRR